ncbi:MAG TPA: Holliday junction branch migration protein RuvA, partial [Candidatus Obscuribacterales bacterium]
LVLDVGGVGFELIVSHRTLLTVGGIGEPAILHTSLSIRENEWLIFAFPAQEEKELFSILQTVSGVGPKLALAVVSTLGVTQLIEAIVSDNHKMVSQAPGVGPKVAQRIILELKSRVEEWNQRRGLSRPADGQAPSRAAEEVQIILEGLGYTATEINMALKKARDEQVADDVEELVRYSLKVLGSTAVSTQ